ncbi:hypothetical protein [Burkholderia sp. BCC1972]|nr:hypothetical protein [Burkholderia sp. BCC1972]
MSALSWSALARLLFPALVGPCNTIAIGFMSKGGGMGGQVLWAWYRSG